MSEADAGTVDSKRGMDINEVPNLTQLSLSLLLECHPYTRLTLTIFDTNKYSTDRV